jgi:hypothetical protein
MANQLTLYAGNSNAVFWDAMTQASDRAFVDDATVTMTLVVTSTGSAVTGASGITLSRVTNSNGRYFGSIPSTASLVAGTPCTLQVTATAGGKTGYRAIPTQIVNRVT